MIRHENERTSRKEEKKRKREETFEAVSSFVEASIRAPELKKKSAAVDEAEDR